MAITLESPIEAVLGTSKHAAKFTKGLGLRTVGDLLHHFPRRYLRTADLSQTPQLHEGEMLTVLGEVVRSVVRQHTDRRTGRPAYRVETQLKAGTADLQLTFFSKSQRIAEWRRGVLAPGVRGVFVGKAGSFRGEWQLANPQMVVFGDDDAENAAEAADNQMAVEELTELFPIYPLTAGLQHWDVMRAVRFARQVVEEVTDVLPEPLRETYAVPGLRDALDLIHAPHEWKDVQRAQHRFRFEEALGLQLVLGRRRRALQALGTTAREGGVHQLLEAFDERLPFTLTTGQQEIGEELEQALAQPHPMNRLLQGEVGSGKTLVALRAMLRVVDSGGQAALLAPTEVLAQQHYRSITTMLGDLAASGLAGGLFAGDQEQTHVELLTGSMTKTQRKGPLSRIATGEAGIVIGTHALLQDQVMFDDLGLVVVDEQHRFGVEQRAALTDKAGTPPHLLVMTATPIPRTVAMTVFGDLEVSTLTELPAGRAEIQTNLVSLVDHPTWITRVWERVKEEVEKGHQVYVVAPRISGDESEQGESDQRDFDADGNEVAAVKAQLSAVDEIAEELTSGPLNGLRVAKLHGKLPAEEKERTMSAFAAGDVDVLVATTVIEVGVDVPNATTMVILDADRFGVSQLHQLRGRVGRGGLHGLCLLVSHAEAGTPARTRLDAVAETTDGFALSRVDLDQRREGDVLGASQSGRRSSLESLRVLRDEETILQAREAADSLLEKDPDLATAPLLAERVTEIEESASADYLEKS
ncbi:ATP-dependent DNA helicase RecG [Nocardioides albus]|uniref:ATP-dependent DNA helicase RecG n=1 Tax=Nocardioides albus TaxID=1841 RepID=A0A7W5A644_9ACTN|nr:ATP-dependent DNA helicase RecG [Nocardioides albus]MBB3090110.1 ATP-dependent DNA helicase RecG [Nocardioides albus]GGU27764.1 ATP-dependent DNA helicase RecG [Nocardioides albus]